MLPSAGCVEIFGTRSRASSPVVIMAGSEDEVLEGKMVGREGERKDVKVLYIALEGVKLTRKVMGEVPL